MVAPRLVKLTPLIISTIKVYVNTNYIIQTDVIGSIANRQNPAKNRQ